MEHWVVPGLSDILGWINSSRQCQCLRCSEVWSGSCTDWQAAVKTRDIRAGLCCDWWDLLLLHVRSLYTSLSSYHCDSRAGCLLNDHHSQRCLSGISRCPIDFHTRAVKWVLGPRGKHMGGLFSIKLPIHTL